MAGKYDHFISKLKNIKKGFESGWDINVWGNEQPLSNYLLDLDKDKYDGVKWGPTYYYCDQGGHSNPNGTPVIKDNKICLNDEAKEMYGDIPLAAIHLNASLNRGKSDKFRFKKLHKELWKQHI